MSNRCGDIVFNVCIRNNDGEFWIQKSFSENIIEFAVMNNFFFFVFAIYLIKQKMTRENIN